MSQKIRGSDVYVVEDIERILAALAGAARRYSGEYGAGYQDALRDVAAGIGATAYDRQLQEVAKYRAERVHETIEYRAERTVEHYQARPAALPGRRSALRSEREEYPMPSRQAPVNMSSDDVSITLFDLAKGRLVTRDVGYGWFGDDGYTAFWDASDWQRVPTEEAQAWGELVPDEWAVLVRHTYANDKRRQLATGQRRQLR